MLKTSYSCFFRSFCCFNFVLLHCYKFYITQSNFNVCSDEGLTLETSDKTPYPTGDKHTISTFVYQTHIQRTRPRRKTVLFSKLVLQCNFNLPWQFQLSVCICILLGITNNIFRPGKSYSKMYGAEPRFNEPRFNELLDLTNRFR